MGSVSQSHLRAHIGRIHTTPTSVLSPGASSVTNTLIISVASHEPRLKVHPAAHPHSALVVDGIDGDDLHARQMTWAPCPSRPQTAVHGESSDNARGVLVQGTPGLQTAVHGRVRPVSSGSAPDPGRMLFVLQLRC